MALTNQDIKMFRAAPLIYDELYDILKKEFLLNTDSDHDDYNPTGIFRKIQAALDWSLGTHLAVEMFPWAVLEFGEIGRVNEDQAPHVYTYPMTIALVLMTFADKGNQELLVRNPHFDIGESYKDRNAMGQNKNPGIMDLFHAVAGFFWGYKHTRRFGEFGIERNADIDYGINQWTFNRLATPTVPAIQGMLFDPQFRAVQVDFVFDIRERNDF